MTRCDLCPGVHQCLPPDGTQGDVLFIGEAPGAQEEQKGRIFIGKTGQEMDLQYLPLAGLARRTVVLANAIACLPTSNGGKLDPNRVKDQQLLECCSRHHLHPLIARMQPRVIVPMGSFACKAICPDVNLEVEHGYPATTTIGGRSIAVFPMYHPALGIHEPKRMLLLRNDWQRLRHYLGGRLQIPADAYAGTEDYQAVTSPSEFVCLDPTLPLALDTESHREGPHCLTYSQQPGYGRLIAAADRDLLAEFGARLERWESDLLIHNWLYDAPVTVAMGIHLPQTRVVDTMVRTFHLGNLPQGLKALAWRELGMVMQDFEDLVLPYSREQVIQYYRAAILEDWPKPEADLVRDETGAWKMYKAQGMNTKLKRFFTDLRNNPAKDVFLAWENWDASHAMVEEVLGPWPGVDIRHAPAEEVLYYACRDVDALIRLWPVLKAMGKRVRKHSQEQWRAA